MQAINHDDAYYSMFGTQNTPAAIVQVSPGKLALSGCWTARYLPRIQKQLDALMLRHADELQLNAAKLEKIDSIAAWVLQNSLKKLRESGVLVTLSEWPEQNKKLLDVVSQQTSSELPAEVSPSTLEQLGKKTYTFWQDCLGLLSFIGETALTTARLLRHPQHLRIKTILHNIQIAGFDALPIVGITAFLLGIVIAYQGAAQLKHYGANIFVVELLGYAMLREFAPLITAIIIAGRSGSAYAAQIGTMVVTEEIDALETVGIPPIELLVIPKVLALLIALPLLTIFADAAGIFGGMVMASSQLDVGFHEFLDRFVTEIPLKTLMLGVGKSLVFAMVIVIIGCFQGFRTQGNADSVGRQTTRSVVQSIFMVIVLDALFSVVFNMLNL